MTWSRDRRGDEHKGEGSCSNEVGRTTLAATRALADVRFGKKCTTAAMLPAPALVRHWAALPIRTPRERRSRATALSSSLACMSFLGRQIWRCDEGHAVARLHSLPHRPHRSFHAMPHRPRGCKISDIGAALRERRLGLAGPICTDGTEHCRRYSEMRRVVVRDLCHLLCASCMCPACLQRTLACQIGHISCLVLFTPPASRRESIHSSTIINVPRLSSVLVAVLGSYIGPPPE
jgi:hypothetical protein